METALKRNHNEHKVFLNALSRNHMQLDLRTINLYNVHVGLRIKVENLVTSPAGNDCPFGRSLLDKFHFHFQEQRSTEHR